MLAAANVPAHIMDMITSNAPGTDLFKMGAICAVSDLRGRLSGKVMGSAADGQPWPQSLICHLFVAYSLGY